MRLLRCYTPEHEKGWVVYLEGEPTRLGESGVVIYCPPCAAASFGFRPDVAAGYICIFDPPPSEAMTTSPNLARCGGRK